MTTNLCTRLLAPALLTMAGLTALCGPALAAGSIKAAYVEEVIPSKTFSANVSLFTGAKAVGPGVGGPILGITSITLTNFDAAPQQVFLFVPAFSGAAADCSGNVIGGGAPQMTVYVPAKSTLHLTYPTPLVVKPVSGFTCYAAEIETIHTNGVELIINGVLNN
jgi:hypothetical protein